MSGHGQCGVPVTLLVEMDISLAVVHVLISPTSVKMVSHVKMLKGNKFSRALTVVAQVLTLLVKCQDVWCPKKLWL